jgi:hypothetical protein
MSLINLVQYGTPVMLLGLICVNIYQAAVIRQLQRDISDLRSSITWGSQCNERHDGINGLTVSNPQYLRGINNG